MDTRNNLLKLNAVIIKEVNYKDYDKLLTLFSKDRGKINVYAFNIRKTNSKNIGKARLFSFGTFELREDNDSYQLENIILDKSFDNLTNDYESICFASYFVELVDYFGYENLESYDVYTLLYYTLKALDTKKVPSKLIKRVFELKMLEYQGIYKSSDMLMSKNETLKYTWDFILNSLPQKLYTFKLSDDIYNLFDAEMSIEMKEKVDKKFKSLNNL